MYVVSGTKRSGTSMWMQAFLAAGLDIVGEPFPRTWGKTALRDANPNGFYESIYRDGIFFGTNPHPQGGWYMRAADTRDRLVKVFVPGVVRTELAFISGVIANVRSWRDYEASVARLWVLEDQQRSAEAPGAPKPLRIPAALEWWSENFALIRDHLQRGYPLMLQTYEQVLADPERYVREALAMVGGEGGDPQAAVAAIQPPSRAEYVRPPDSVEPRIADALDELYGVVERRLPFSRSLLRKLDAIDREVKPTIHAIKAQSARKLLLAGATPSPALMLAVSMA